MASSGLTTPLAAFPSPGSQGYHLEVHRGLEPPLDVEQHPRRLGVLPHRPQQQLPVDAVEKGLDVQVKNPVVPPAPLSRHPERFLRRLARPVPVGVWVKDLSSPGSMYRLTTVWATRSATVGIPSGLVPPSFGISTRRTGGGK